MNFLPYSPEVQTLLELGIPEGATQPDAWLDYRELGLTAAHIPELINLVQDEGLRFADQEDPEADEAVLDLEASEDETEFPPQVYAQIHAWRALGQLQATEAIPALIDLLPQVDRYDDEWVLEELPKVFALIGPECIEPLRAFALERSHSTYDRITAIDSLVTIGQKHPDSKSRCVEIVAECLNNYQQEDEIVNSFLIHALTQFEAVEHLPLIQAAYEADTVDTMLQGDFDDVRADLGLIPAPPPRPSFFDQALRRTPGSEMGKAMSDPANQAAAKDKKAKKKEKARRKQEKKSRKKNRRR